MKLQLEFQTEKKKSFESTHTVGIKGWSSGICLIYGCQHFRGIYNYHLLSWRRRQQIPPEGRHSSTKVHGITSKRP